MTPYASTLIRLAKPDGNTASQPPPHPCPHLSYGPSPLYRVFTPLLSNPLKRNFHLPSPPDPSVTWIRKDYLVLPWRPISHRGGNHPCQQCFCNLWKKRMCYKRLCKLHDCSPESSRQLLRWPLETLQIHNSRWILWQGSRRLSPQTCHSNKQSERFELTCVWITMKLMATLCQKSQRIISVFITCSSELLLPANDKRSSMSKCTQARFC